MNGRRRTPEDKPNGMVPDIRTCRILLNRTTDEGTEQPSRDNDARRRGPRWDRTVREFASSEKGRDIRGTCSRCQGFDGGRTTPFNPSGVLQYRVPVLTVPLIAGNLGGRWVGPVGWHDDTSPSISDRSHEARPAAAEEHGGKLCGAVGGVERVVDCQLDSPPVSAEQGSRCSGCNRGGEARHGRGTMGKRLLAAMMSASARACVGWSPLAREQVSYMHCMARRRRSRPRRNGKATPRCGSRRAIECRASMAKQSSS